MGAGTLLRVQKLRVTLETNVWGREEPLQILLELFINALGNYKVGIVIVTILIRNLRKDK